MTEKQDLINHAQSRSPTPTSASLGHEQHCTESKPKHDNSFIQSTSFWNETWIMLQIFFPICIAALAEYAPQVVINNIIGHLPNAPHAISSVGFARMFSQLTGNLICMGMISCLYTYIPQAIGGGKKEHLHIHIQRAFVITFVLMIPIVVLQFFADKIFAAFREPSDILRDTKFYCLLIIPNIYGKTWLFIVQRVAQSLNFNYCVLWATLIVALLMYPLNILFVDFFDFGFMGSAFALDFASIVSFICIALYLCYKGYGYIFIPMCFSFHSLQQLCDKNSIYDYFALSLPGLAQSCFEWFIMQIGTILSGYIVSPKIAISATIIMGLMNGICIMFCWGCYTAVNIRVGKYIGAGKEFEAKRSAKSGLFISLTISVIIILFLLLFRNEIPYFFTNDEAITALLSQLIIVLCFQQFFMVIYNNLSAIYRGIGLQKKSAIMVLIGYYCITLPITLIILFLPSVDLRCNAAAGTMAIWSSLAFGNLIAAITLFSYLLCKVNWNNVISESRMRLKRTSNLLRTENYGSISK